MYLYNVSIIIEESSHSDLLAWIKNEWLPELPKDVKFLKMLHSPHEGHTYCVHVIVPSEHDIHQFNTQYIERLSQHIGLMHKDKAFLFDSIMQYLA